MQVSKNDGSRDAFLRETQAEQLDRNTVAFVLRSGKSRFDLIESGQQALPDHLLIDPDLLEYWSYDPRFITPNKTDEQIIIVGNVRWGEDLTFLDQLCLLESEGLEVARAEDFVAAFVVFFVLTTKPIMSEDEDDWIVQGSRSVRTEREVLSYNIFDGLGYYFVDAELESPNTGIAARLFI